MKEQASKPRFTIEDVVEVSVTGTIVSVTKSMLNGEIQYQLKVESGFGSSFFTVPESAIVHPLPEDVE